MSICSMWRWPKREALDVNHIIFQKNQIDGSGLVVHANFVECGTGWTDSIHMNIMTFFWYVQKLWKVNFS